MHIRTRQRRPRGNGRNVDGPVQHAIAHIRSRCSHHDISGQRSSVRRRRRRPRARSGSATLVGDNGHRIGGRSGRWRSARSRSRVERYEQQ